MDKNIEQMTLEQKVGQLFMTGMPANNYNQATFDAIEKYQVGSIILTGRSNKFLELIHQESVKNPDLGELEHFLPLGHRISRVCD